MFTPIRHALAFGLTPLVTTSPPISIMKLLMPCLRNICATQSDPNPFATALRSIIMRGSSRKNLLSFKLIRFQPINCLRLSTCSESGSAPCLKPNPQAFTSGATVMSKAPSVAWLTSRAMWNMVLNNESVSLLLPELIWLIVLLGLNMESDWSTACSSSRILPLRLLSH